MIRRYVLCVLVTNAAGVLYKVSGLFSRRGYNIHSLSVGETQNPDISRITIELLGDEKLLEQIKKQLDKLTEVIKIKSVRSSDTIYKELMLVKVKATAKNRADIIAICEVFRTKIVDVAKNSLIIEITGAPEKNYALTKMLEDYGIIEIARTGITAMERGENNIYN